MSYKAVTPVKSLIDFLQENKQYKVFKWRA